MVAKQRERTFEARLSRRSALAALAGVAALPLVGRAQEDEAGDGGGDELVIAEAPSFGVRRPGPVELAAAPLAKDVDQRKALVPVQMVVPNAGVDAPIEVGTITVGKRADLTVFDIDLMTVPEERIVGGVARMTVVDGRIRHRFDGVIPTGSRAR